MAGSGTEPASSHAVNSKAHPLREQESSEAGFSLTAPGSPMKSERRQTLRQNPPSLIYLDLEPNNGGIVLDLSESGMQISVANPLVGCGEIRFSFCLETRKRIRGSGRIAWVSASGKSAGVRFHSMPPQALSQIRESLLPPAETSEPVAEVFEPAPTELGTPAPSMEVSETEATIPSAFQSDDGEENSSSKGSTAEIHESARPVFAETAPTEPTPASDFGAMLGFENKRETLADDQSPEPTPKRPARGSAYPSHPPPWLEAMIRAGRREEFEEEGNYGSFWTTPQTEEDWRKADELNSAEAQEASGGEIEFQETPPTPLYLPNYKLEEHPASRAGETSAEGGEVPLRVAAKLACERFEEFGWTLERDWHIWLALVLLLAGFLALAQKPPLVVLSGALWVASAIVALKRKEKPRPAGSAEPDRQ